MTAELIAYIPKRDKLYSSKRVVNFELLLKKLSISFSDCKVENIISEMESHGFYWRKMDLSDQDAIRNANTFKQIHGEVGSDRPLIFRNIYDVFSDIHIAGFVIAYDTELDLNEESFEPRD